MKKFIDNLKDLFYDSVDVLLVIVIFIAVGGTILWRLDILFAPDVDKAPLEQPADIGEPKDDSTANNDDNTNNSDDSTQNQDDLDETNQGSPENNNQQDNQGNNQQNDNNSNNDSTNVKTVTVVIPESSSGPTIADILINSGLISTSDKWTFLNRAVEMGLDTKFKPGTFEIKNDASFDTIIKTIAKNL
ncbi:hypothetical protein [Sporosalibacterium faouarense]|uniref:hypothetical protein n=1 Tax=Sporosalibacterium faouarense TaxID=516123 RepID=UPI00141CE4D9|nr:hypothetical protein [Sporosalibacterium faouarense]MTI47016.1 endolytic transglycosylase MltG [Bacillota bacterium]